MCHTPLLAMPCGADPGGSSRRRHTHLRLCAPAYNSSRYFALRIQNARGKTALVGIVFTERARAFDFKMALHEHEEYVVCSWCQYRLMAASTINHPLRQERC